MDIHFSKLKKIPQDRTESSAWFVALWEMIAPYIKQAAEYIVVNLQDLYIWVIGWIYWAVQMISATVCGWLCRVITRKSPRVIYAHGYAGKCKKDGRTIGARVDLTPAVIYFYMFDSYRSVASLQRWLFKVGYDLRSISLVYTIDDSVYCSEINLDEDSEILTGEYVIDGDMALDRIPRKKVYPMARASCIEPSCT